MYTLILIFLSIFVIFPYFNAYAEDNSITLVPLTNEVFLDGKIGSQEWEDSEKISKPSPDSKGTFDVYYKYDVEHNVLLLGLSSYDETPMFEDTFAIDLDFSGDDTDFTTPDDYQINITPVLTTIWNYDDRGNARLLNHTTPIPFEFSAVRHNTDTKHSLELIIGFDQLPKNQSMRFVYADSPCDGCPLMKSEFGQLASPSTWYRIDYSNVPEFSTMLVLLISFSFLFLLKRNLFSPLITSVK